MVRLLFLDFVGNWNMQQIKMMRAPASMVHRTGRKNFIEDRGVLVPASRGSGYNAYMFADTPVGARDLVLVGTLAQIVDFFKRESMYGIENTISTQPIIYAGLTLHRPRSRFRTLFATNDQAMAWFNVANTLFRCVALKDWSTGKFMPQDSHDLAHKMGQIGDCTQLVGDVGDPGDLIATGYDMVKRIIDPGIAESKAKGGPELCLTFSPSPGDGMWRAGQRRVHFSQFLGRFAPNHMPDYSGDFGRLFAH